MKRINLITPKIYFPVEPVLQKKIIFLLFLFYFGYFGIRTFYDYEEIKKGRGEIASINQEINGLKQSLSEKKSLDEKTTYIEREFSAVAADYQLLKKNIVIRDIFAMISRIVPANTWITSLEFQYAGDKSLLIKGKSMNKEEVFTFLKNSTSIGKSSELITMQTDGNSSFFFEIRLELT